MYKNRTYFRRAIVIEIHLLSRYGAHATAGSLSHVRRGKFRNIQRPEFFFKSEVLHVPDSGDFQVAYLDDPQAEGARKLVS